jgi:hypothetical protein
VGGVRHVDADAVAGDGGNFVGGFGGHIPRDVDGRDKRM